MGTNPNKFTGGLIGPDPPYGGRDAVEAGKIERDVTKSEVVKRRAELLLNLERAAGSDKKLNAILGDEEKREFVLGLITHNDDGSDQYLSTGVQKITGRLEGLELAPLDEFKAILLRLNREAADKMNAQVEAKKALKEAANIEEKAGGSVLKNIGLAEALVVGDIDTVTKQRTALFDAARITIRSVSAGTTEGVLLTQILPLVTNHVPPHLLAKLQGMLGGPNIMSVTKSEDVLKILQEAGVLSSFSQSFDLADTRKAIAEELTQVRLQKNVLDANKAVARRRFNDRFGGSDADTVINFAIADTKIDFKLLADQLKTLDVSIPEAELIKASKLVNINGSIGTFADRTDLEPLAIFIRSRGLDNPTGVSLENIASRTAEKMLVHEWATDLIAAATDKANQTIDLGKLQKVIATLDPIVTEDQLRAQSDLEKGGRIPHDWENNRLIAFIQEKSEAFLSVLHLKDLIEAHTNQQNLDIAGLHTIVVAQIPKGSFSKEDLQQAAGLDDTGTIPVGWTDATLLSFLRGKALESVTGINMKHVVDVSWSEKTKEYAKTIIGVGAAGTKLWWNWFSSLPENLKTQPEDFKNILKRESALESALATLKDQTETWSKYDKGYFDDAFDDLRQLQKNLDTGMAPVAPARSIGERVEQGTKLLKAAEFVFAGLNTGTNYGLETDQYRRRNAFYIAMNKGLSDANEYLVNSEAYELSHPELFPGTPEGDAQIAFNKNVRQGEVTRGDNILAGMRKKLGIRVAPMALPILQEMKGPDGLPLGVGATRFDNWLTHPELARPALEKIIMTDPTVGIVGGKEALLDVFTSKIDKPGILTFAEANNYVSLIRQHLITQGEDMQANRHHAMSEGRASDPMNVLRGGADAVISMLSSDDPIEKGLAIALIVGAGYAIYKGWQRGGWTRGAIVGIPLFFGADIALKKATGEGLMDRLNLNYMNDKDKLASQEQFIRNNGNIPRYDFLTTNAGRAAVKQLTSVNSPIKVEDLLAWRKQVHAGGEKNFGNGAPEALLLSPVVAAMGSILPHSKKGAELRDEAYRLAYFAFEALCADTARANGLGGDNIHIQAERGAELIEHRYVKFDEKYLVDTGIQTAFKKSIGPSVTMRQILSYERLTPEVADTMANSSLTEWGAAKLGVVADVIKGGLKNGKKEAETQFAKAKEKVPEVYRVSKKNILASYDSFKEWAGPAYANLSQEFSEDYRGTYELLKGAASSTGAILQKTPEGIVWVVDSTTFVADRYIGAWMNAWHSLHSSNFLLAGGILQGFENKFTELFGAPPEEIAFRDLADIARYTDELTAMIDRSGAGDTTTKNTVGDWLKNMNIVSTMSPEQRVIKFENLKRSVYALLLAYRFEEAENNKSVKQYQLKILKKRALPTDKDIDPATGKFSKLPSSIEPLYEYLYKNYVSNEDDKSIFNNILPFLGREVTNPGNWIKEEDAAGGIIGGVAEYTVGRFLYDDASDSMQKAIEAYEKPFFAQAEKTLSGDDLKAYKSYVRTVILNVILERTLTLSNPTTDIPLKLSKEEAEKIRQHLQRLRGNSVSLKRVADHQADLGVFHQATKSALPLEVEKLLAERNFQRILRGDPAVVPPATTTNSPSGGGSGSGPNAGGGGPSGNGPSTGPSPAPVVPPTGPSGVYKPPENAPTSPPAAPDEQGRVKGLEPSNPNERRDMLDKLPQMGSSAPDVRNKFDKWFRGEAWFGNAGSKFNESELLDAVQGMSDAKVADAELLYLNKFVKSVDDVKELVTKRSEAGPNSAAGLRLQRLLDRATIRVLKDVIAPLLTKDPEQQTADLVTLMEIAKTGPNPGIDDTISMGLELIFHGNKFDNVTYDQYVAYLAAQKTSLREAAGAFAVVNARKRITNKVKITPLGINNKVSTIDNLLIKQ